MRCSGCGTQVPDDAKFCPGCGGKSLAKNGISKPDRKGCAKAGFIFGIITLLSGIVFPIITFYLAIPGLLLGGIGWDSSKIFFLQVLLQKSREFFRFSKNILLQWLHSLMREKSPKQR